MKNKTNKKQSNDKKQSTKIGKKIVLLGAATLVVGGAAVYINKKIKAKSKPITDNN